MATAWGRGLGAGLRRGRWFVAVATVVSLVSAAGCAGDDSPSIVADPASTDPTVAPGDTSDPASADSTLAPGDTTDPESTESDTSPAPDGEALEVSAALRGRSGLTAEVVVAADPPVAVVVTATSSDHVVDVPMTATVSGEHVIPVVGMRSDREYEITVTTYDEAGAVERRTSAGLVRTEPLPPWMPQHEITIGEGAARGYTLVETSPPVDADGSHRFPDQPAQVVIAYDDEGEIVWYYTNTGAIGGVEQTPRGTFLNHYWPFGIREVDVWGDLVGHWRPQPADSPGEDVDDEALVEVLDPDAVERWADALRGNPGDMEPLAVRADWVDVNGFHHENWPMPNGNVLAMSTAIHELTDEQRAAFCPGDDTAFDVISDLIVEFEPDGTVVRTWDLWDAIDVDEHPGSQMCIDEGLFAEPVNRDWTHANSVVYDPGRDAIIISSRHTDQIVAFDHLDEVGHQSKVRWILGAGSTMPFDGEPSYHQHAVEVIDETRIILYDNGNGRPGTTGDDPERPPYSRAVIYEVDDTSPDPADWSARQVWEHLADEDDGTPIYASFISDADMLENGNVLITHGGIGSRDPEDDDPLRALIIEVVPEGVDGGEIVWELRSDPSSPNTSYRSERITSFYVGDAWVTG